MELPNAQYTCSNSTLAGRKSEKATGRKAPLALYFQNFTDESLRYFYYYMPAATVQRAFCRFFACTVTNIKTFADTSLFIYKVHRSVEVWKASLFCSTKFQISSPVYHWPGWWPACQPAWPSIPEDCSSSSSVGAVSAVSRSYSNQLANRCSNNQLANWPGRNDQSLIDILVSTYFEIRLPLPILFL